MRADELKNWLTALGIGGGLAIGGSSSEALTADHHGPPKIGEPTRATREREPLYVVINHEEQYSIWPARETLPPEWRRVSDPLDLGAAVERFPAGGRLRFRVVINHEEQYSIWPLDRQMPKGFRPAPPVAGQRPCEIKVCGELVQRLDRRPR